MDSNYHSGLTSSPRVRILSDDWSTFGQIATVEHPNPVPGSSQIWLKAEDGTRIVVAVHEVEAV